MPRSLLSLIPLIFVVACGGSALPDARGATSATTVEASATGTASAEAAFPEVALMIGDAAVMSMQADGRVVSEALGDHVFTRDWEVLNAEGQRVLSVNGEDVIFHVSSFFQHASLRFEADGEALHLLNADGAVASTWRVEEDGVISLSNDSGQGLQARLEGVTDAYSRRVGLVLVLLLSTVDIPDGQESGHIVF